MESLNRAAVFASLQAEILRLQGFTAQSSSILDLELGPLREAFPNGSFPLGAVHEFISAQREDAAATNGFLAGLLTTLMGSNGTVLWISSSRTLFPPSLKNFGLHPHRFVFIDLQKEKEVMWATEEALKCGAVAAVVGEMRDVSFTDSRRLQLAVEHSHVTGFILRHQLRQLSTTACISRWKITSLPSAAMGSGVDDLPGIGFPAWRVELLRMRNGKPGVWDMQWSEGRFHTLYHETSIAQGLPDRKAG